MDRVSGVFRVVWFDSLGAKSSCIVVDSRDARLVVDPGVAVMHPSYPASPGEKARLKRAGYERVVGALAESGLVVVTHYHYDHYLHEERDIALYRGKTILAKNPNEYINDSQRKRAYEFYQKLYEQVMGVRLEEVLEEPIEKDYPNPLREIPEALKKSYGDYSERRAELLEQGLKWFKKRVEKWNSYRRIPEIGSRDTRVVFADGESYEYGSLKIRFSKPLFHGVEFSRVGWVVSLVVEARGVKIYYSSDVNGPIIEDYAYAIISENPDVLVLDGPPTYTLGYMLNKINLKRAVENAERIIEEATRLKLLIYDHHLAREPRFKERTKSVWVKAEKNGVVAVTAAEYLGLEPHVVKAAREGRKELQKQSKRLES